MRKPGHWRLTKTTQTSWERVGVIESRGLEPDPWGSNPSSRRSPLTSPCLDCAHH